VRRCSQSLENTDATDVTPSPENVAVDTGPVVRDVRISKLPTTRKSFLPYRRHERRVPVTGTHGVPCQATLLEVAGKRWATAPVTACAGGRNVGDGRQAQRGLENHCARKGTGGSNPSPSDSLLT
jgi:hypothetical protein